MKKEIAARMIRLAKMLVGDMTWEECIADAKKTGKDSPEKFCGWLRYYGPHGIKKSSQREADWESVRKDVDVTQRNKEMFKSLSSFAPSLSSKLKTRMAKELERQGYDVDAKNLKREWSQYLAYVAPDENSNKYHYYAVYSFPSNGTLLYMAANCSGRIGIIERAYDLTKGRYSSSISSAMNAAEGHMNKKLRHPRTPYQKVRMTRG